MIFTPQLLGIFEQNFGSEANITISRAILVAVVGFVTVIVLLAIIALFIKFIAFVFSVATKKATAPTPAATVPSVPKSASSAEKTATALRGEIKLTDVDEPTAAVIMALVSHNSGIPLDRLDFKSIKLLEDK